MQHRNQLEFDRLDSSKELQAMSAVDCYVIHVMDGSGKEATRLVFRIKGDRQFYFLLPEGAEEKLQKPSPWLQKLLEERAATLSNPVLPTAADVPVGNPLEA